MYLHYYLQTYKFNFVVKSIHENLWAMDSLLGIGDANVRILGLLRWKLGHKLMILVLYCWTRKCGGSVGLRTCAGGMSELLSLQAFFVRITLSFIWSLLTSICMFIRRSCCYQSWTIFSVFYSFKSFESLYNLYKPFTSYNTCL